jgi:ABC-type nitrate/sulfonate/bicarbonate transport system substrate-binding protein
MRRIALCRLFVVALVAVMALSGCGSGTSHQDRQANLVLDFTPNAIHAGIYVALARGYDRSAGVRLHVIAPSASTDAVKLLLTGRTQFAILDIHDLAIARARGQDLVGIMAIVQRPLASVIAAPRFASPRDLAGRTVGVTGAASDLAVLRSVLAGAGARPGSVHTITIGFNAVPDLLDGRVAAATAFWNDEGVTVQHAGRGFHIFRVDDYGAPPYPELVVCATASELRADPGLAHALVRALVRGYDTVLRTPAAGERALETLVPGLSRKLVTEQLTAVLPAFRPAHGGFGALDPNTLDAWARWEAKFGIVNRPPDVAAMFNRSFLPNR